MKSMVNSCGEWRTAAPLAHTPPNWSGVEWIFIDPACRTRASGAEILEDDHENPLAHHREIWLRDPDGYIVVVSSPFGQNE
jgi:hypothetical protein